MHDTICTPTGAVGSDPAVITKSVDVVEGMSAGAAALARSAWFLAARWQFSKHRPSGTMLSISRFVRLCVCPGVHF